LRWWRRCSGKYAASHGRGAPEKDESGSLVVQVVEKIGGGKMKNILLFIIVFLTCYQYSYAENEKNFLYKDYYFGMPLEEARKINNATPCKDNPENLCFSNEVFIKDKKWNVELIFEKNNILTTVMLEESKTERLSCLKSIALILKNDMLFSMCFSDRKIFDLIKHRNEINELGKIVLDIIEDSELYTAAFFDKQYIQYNQNNIQPKDIVELVSQYPKEGRVVLVNKINGKTYIVFGTVVDFILTLESYIEKRSKRDF
jgi:hypothetical protein